VTVIVTPMSIEARAVRAGLTGTPTVVASGIGMARARAAGARLAALGAPVVVTGFAGGLLDGQHPGQVVVATEVRVAGGAPGGLPVPAAAALADQLRRAGHDVVTGPIVSSRRVARGATARRELAAGGAVAVDMESAWLAGRLLATDPTHVAVVRVLTDTPEHELLDRRTLPGAVGAYRTLRRITPVIEAWAAAVRPRDVLLAHPRSFCAGVERAIATVRRALEIHGPPVYVRRQIIHNTHVVDDLAGAGAVFVHELDEVPPGSVTVLAAHGVAPEVRTQASERQLQVIDATCPLVAKVHAEVRSRREAGYSIVLIGHEDHEEVVGTRGEAPDDIHVIAAPGDVDRLAVADPDRVAYLTQTTLALDETADVIERLEERFPAIVAPRSHDICYATQNRQLAVRKVAAASELVLVVGSANSSNSNRLVEVARREGAAAHLVEDETQIDLTWLAGVDHVGVTAGASAPEHLVQRVVERLASLGRLDVTEHVAVDEDVQFLLPAEVR
jgi:4-hydroxy-3-methylbut-2-en-1-yl diphosphate reductase